MQLETPNKQQEVELDMTPMIDVVFLLIIFFMVVSEITKMQSHEGIVLPLASEARPDEDKERMVINVDENGEMFTMGGRVTKEELQRQLKIEAKISADPQGFSKRAVLVRADKRVEYRHIARIMMQCQEARIWKLSFGSKPLPVPGQN